jgi:thioesterase domain-containing protein/NADP-dependent 3-hydroxy acid dehydrogenase YdfG/acyl carrier protein
VLGEAPQIEGIELQTHPDLGALAASLSAEEPAPALVLAPLQLDAGIDPAAALGASAATLSLIGAWLAEERFGASRLVLLTRGAVMASAGESPPDPVAAAIWGLVRSAQSEHPGRFALVDADQSEASWQALPALLEGEESQLALRDGGALVPRLSRAGAEPLPEQASALDPEATVLITGASSDLGALLATHLVKAHGARHLLLLGPSGPEAEGAAELQAELAELGAEVRLESCGLADRTHLQQLIESIDPQHPLGAVVHAAGALEDTPLERLEPAQLQAACAAEAQAAQSLHELTAQMELSAFLLCSAAATVLGTPGQGATAAAGSYLDALARQRQAEGLPASSIAIGAWAPAEAPEPQAEENQSARSGILPLSAEQALAGFDAALAAGGAEQLVAVAVDKPALRVFAEAGMLAPLLRGLVRTPPRRGDGEGADLAAQLRAAGDEAAREAIVLALVRGQVASVLGHDSAQAIGADQAFTELGFDSLAAVELRNRLSDAVGVELAPTLAYDHPTPAATAAHMRIQIEREDGGAADRDSEAGSDRISIGSMLATARERGMAMELIGLLAAAAAFRPKFDGGLDREETPAPVRLAEGPDAPSLICLSSIVPMSGPHEYAEIAKELRGSREVLTLPQSGFVSGELVPGSRDAAIATQVEAVRRLATDRPFALLGHSSGGLFAHAVAGKLEEEGLQAAAVVLIDTYEMSESSVPLMMDLLAQIIFATETMSGGLNDTRLTAMGAYLPLLAEWEVPSIAAPTLLVRASDPMPGMPAAGDWRASWQGCDAEIQVAGDHLTMMHEHAASTVAAIEGWLTTRASVGPSGGSSIQTSAR